MENIKINRSQQFSVDFETIIQLSEEEKIEISKKICRYADGISSNHFSISFVIVGYKKGDHLFSIEKLERFKNYYGSPKLMRDIIVTLTKMEESIERI